MSLCWCAPAALVTSGILKTNDIAATQTVVNGFQSQVESAMGRSFAMFQVANVRTRVDVGMYLTVTVCPLRLELTPKGMT